MPLEKLDGVGGGVCLAETLVMCNTVEVHDDHVRRVRVGEKIQYIGSAVFQVRTVEDTDEVVLNSSHNLLLEGAVHILEPVEGDRCRVVGVSD